MPNDPGGGRAGRRDRFVLTPSGQPQAVEAHDAEGERADHQEHEDGQSNGVMVTQSATSRPERPGRARPRWQAA